MPGFSFFKRPKPRSFDFIPQHYDPKKEELNARVGQYDQSVSPEERAKQRISSGIRKKYYGDDTLKKSETKRANFRLLYIIITLFFVTYMIMQSDRFLHIIESISE